MGIGHENIKVHFLMVKMCQKNTETSLNKLLPVKLRAI